MKSLTIKDLTLADELSDKAMAAVRGGVMASPKMPSCCFANPQSGWASPLSFGVPSAPATTTTNNVSLSQANNQYQANATGNGSAVFGGSIAAYNNQQGFNFVG